MATSPSDTRTTQDFGDFTVSGGSVAVQGSISGGLSLQTISRDDRDDQCLADLRGADEKGTDPRDDKTRIQETKGGLFGDSYRWVLNSVDFKSWKSNPQGHILWIRGDPGKGKTMLLCGIIDELHKSQTTSLSYFFCQSTDAALNNANGILRGLIYLLVDQTPSLLSHIRRKYQQAGKQLFEGRNSWEALSKILLSILSDSVSENTVLVIDALDECVEGLPRLLEFICTASATSRAKWIISSRNWPSITERLSTISNATELCLEQNSTNVSLAVEAYIRHKVQDLSRAKQFDDSMREQLVQHLVSNAHDTFLWAALVCQELANEKVRKRHTLAKLKQFPPGLDSLYQEMMGQVGNSLDANICKKILAIVSVAYQPININELCHLIDLPDDEMPEEDEMPEIIQSCGSFLTLRDGVLYLVHQSAREYLLGKAADHIIPLGLQQLHHGIFSKSLLILSHVLKRDMYDLKQPGYRIEQVVPPQPDPLAAIRYSCVYWISHFIQSEALTREYSAESETVVSFFRQCFLFWLEALSLLRAVSDGAKALQIMHESMGKGASQDVLEWVHDAQRFILMHRKPIEIAPLQVYVSALVFSPMRSLIRVASQAEEPEWLPLKPALESNWDSCLQTIEGHDQAVLSIAFSTDGNKLASASSDGKVKIWDSVTGTICQTVAGHSGSIQSVKFSLDDQVLATASSEGKLTLWDPVSGVCLCTLNGHKSLVHSIVFSADGKYLLSSDGTMLNVWDMKTSKCSQSRTSQDKSIDISGDGKYVATGSSDETIKILDLSTLTCVKTFRGHRAPVQSVAFSNSSQQIASASADRTVRLWDINTSTCLQVLIGHDGWVISVVFSKDDQRVASSSSDWTIKIWDRVKGLCLQTLSGHDGPVYSIAFSADGRRLASGSADKTIKTWDLVLPEDLANGTQGHSALVRSVVFSPDGRRLVSTSPDMKVKLWDCETGHCIATLAACQGAVYSSSLVAFSADSHLLAYKSDDDIVKIWDMRENFHMKTLLGHNNTIQFITFSPDDQHLASTSQDGVITIWDVASGTSIKTLGSSNTMVKSVLYSELRSQIIVVSSSTIEVWDILEDWHQILLGHEGCVNSIALSQDHQSLVSTSDDKTIKIWNITLGVCLQTLHGHTELVHLAVFSPYGTWVASAAADGTIRLWDIDTGACFQKFDGIHHNIRFLAFSLDGAWLASTSEDGNLELRDPTSSSTLHTLEGHSGAVSSLAFSVDNQLMASASYDCTIRIWHIESMCCLETLVGHQGPVTSVAFSVATQLLSASTDRTIKIWDPDTASCLQTIFGHEEAIISAQYVSDGQLVACISEDGVVKLWDLTTGNCVQTYGIPAGGVDSINSIVYSPDGQLLASSFSSGIIKIWNPTESTCLQQLDGHQSSTHFITFAPNSEYLASASHDRSIKMWNPATGECVQTLVGHMRFIRSIAMSEDGLRLASVSEDETLRIWDHVEGICLATYFVGHSLQIFRFESSISNRLRTPFGVVEADISPDNSPLVPRLRGLVQVGYGISNDREWISKDGTNLLWLPPQFRSSASAVSAVSGQTIAIGCNSGHVLFLRLQ